MRFKIFQINYLDKSYIKKVKTINVEEMFESLNNLPLMYGDNKHKYAIINLHKEKHVILGTLTQEYSMKLTKFSNDKTKAEVPINESVANDNTYFYIDTIKGHMCIQNRRFPSDSGLKTLFMMRRFKNILNLVFQNQYRNISLIPEKIEYTYENFNYYFKNSIVNYLEFKNIKGIELPKGLPLHNPRIDLDEALTESWNIYSKDDLDGFELKATDYKALNKNPLAKIGMNLAREGNISGIEVIKTMKIKDDGEETTLKPKGNDHKIIEVSNDIKNDPYKTYEKILYGILTDYSGRF